MFPRRYFPGRLFTPVYFPQSQGTAPSRGGSVRAAARVVPRVSANASAGPQVTATARVGDGG